MELSLLRENLDTFAAPCCSFVSFRASLSVCLLAYLSSSDLQLVTSHIGVLWGSEVDTFFFFISIYCFFILQLIDFACVRVWHAV